MLPSLILAASLLASQAATVNSPACFADEVPALPTALSEQRIALFFAPSPLPAPPVVDKQAARNKSLRESLARMLQDRQHRAVKVKLASQHEVVGKLVAVNDQSFTLQTRKHSAPLLIRYQDVVGFPQQKLSVGAEIGRDVLIAGIVILAIPALPVIPLFLIGISTGLIND